MNTAIKNIFAELNKRVAYVYFRNRKYLEDLRPGDDIDILIRRKDIVKLNKVLYRYGYVALMKIGAKTRNIGYFNYIQPGLPSFDVQIERICKIQYVEGGEFLKNRILKNGIYVLNPRYKLIILIFKDLLLHGTLGLKRYSPSKKKEIRTLWKEKKNRDFFEEKSQDILGSATKEIVRHIEAGEFGKISDSRGRWRISACLKHPSFGLHILNNLFHYLIYQRFLKKSTRISFIGVDGSGKTTTIDNLEKALAPCSHTSIYMGRWIRMTAIRKATRMANKLTEKRKGEGINVLNSIKYLTRDLLYIMKYYSVLFFKLIPYKFKYDYILTDRYIYDLKVQKKRVKMWDFIINYLYPKPDVLINLYHDPVKIHARKKQFTVGILKEQQDILRKQTDKFGGHHVQTVDKKKTVEEIMKILLKHKNKKYYYFL